MRILELYSESAALAENAKFMIVQQFNTWSRLQRLSNDENYTTSAFGIDLWQEHATKPNIFWLNFSSIYENLGDDGKLIADQFLGEKIEDGQGLLLDKPLLLNAPKITLTVKEVTDLVADGYLNLEQTQNNI